jgi:hypothetical protein
VLPQVPPERLNLTLKQLTPEQIRGVDTGRYQLGAVIDMAELLGELEPDFPLTRKKTSTNGYGKALGNINGETYSSRSINWLASSSDNASNEYAAEDVAAPESIAQRLKKAPINTEMHSVRHESLQKSENEKGEAAEGAADRLSEIAERVERLERLMAVK